MKKGHRYSGIQIDALPFQLFDILSIETYSLDQINS